MNPLDQGATEYLHNSGSNVKLVKSIDEMTVQEKLRRLSEIHDKTSDKYREVVNHFRALTRDYTTFVKATFFLFKKLRPYAIPVKIDQALDELQALLLTQEQHLTEEKKGS